MHETYRLSEQIAAAMAAHSVPAIAALTCSGDPVQEIDDITLLVYPWIAGEVLEAPSVEPKRGKQIGAVLGHMHALNLQIPALPLSEWGSFHDDDWDLLSVQAYDQGIAWARHVRVAMPRLIEWSRLYEQAGARLSQEMVLSHRDIDQKNVIWRDEHTPLLVDWESAGLVNPMMELASVALDWSGLAIEAVREDTFSALVEGYVLPMAAAIWSGRRCRWRRAGGGHRCSARRHGHLARLAVIQYAAFSGRGQQRRGRAADRDTRDWFGATQVAPTRPAC